MEATTQHPHHKKPPDPPGKRSYANVAKDHTSEMMKNYASLVEIAKNERNVLEIKFTRIPDSTADRSRRQYVESIFLIKWD